MQNFYDLDFNSIKDNIKLFMKDLETFKDYNFEGSAASELTDVLAYITQYPAFYLSQVLNEFFIKTAQITDNVYKLAHQLNYLPKRKSSASINVLFQRTSELIIIIPKFTKFQMGDLYLTNIEDIIINTDDIYEITLYEGEPIFEYFISDGSDKQLYELKNRETIDNDFFFVYVDATDGIGGYVLDNNLWINLNKESFQTFENAYYIRYFEKFNIAFDSGSLFNKPNENDRVRIIYINTNGLSSNGLIDNILLDSSETISNSEYLLITNPDSNTSKNGTDEETEEEIKMRAPLFYTTQNRAVTERDHNIIATQYSKYSIFEDVTLWGGEKEFIDINGDFDINSVDRDLGHVYVTTLKSESLDYLTTTEIDNFISFLNQHKFITIFFKFIHPTIIKIIPTINISFRSILDIDQVDIQEQINLYLDTNEGFKKTFYLSDIISFVDSINVVEYNYIDFESKAIVKSSNPKIIRLNEAIIEGSITGTIDSLALTDSGGIVYHDGISCGIVNYSLGWIKLTKTFTDTEYEITFEYEYKEKIVLERENFLKYDDVILNIL